MRNPTKIYALDERTSQRVRQLLRDEPDRDYQTDRYVPVPTDDMVLVTWVDETGFSGVGKIVSYNGDLQAWVEGLSVQVMEANQRQLAVGTRYPAISAGSSGQVFLLYSAGSVAAVGSITDLPALNLGELYLAGTNDPVQPWELWVGTTAGNYLIACGCPFEGSGSGGSSSVTPATAGSPTAFANVIWSEPVLAGDAVQIAGSLQDLCGNPLYTSACDIELTVTDGETDASPSHTATLSPAAPGTWMEGGTGVSARAIVRTAATAPAFGVSVNDPVDPTSKWLWVCASRSTQVFVKGPPVSLYVPPLPSVSCLDCTSYCYTFAFEGVTSGMLACADAFNAPNWTLSRLGGVSTPEVCNWNYTLNPKPVGTSLPYGPSPGTSCFAATTVDETFIFELWYYREAGVWVLTATWGGGYPSCLMYLGQGDCGDESVLLTLASDFDSSMLPDWLMEDLGWTRGQSTPTDYQQTAFFGADAVFSGAPSAVTIYRSDCGSGSGSGNDFGSGSGSGSGGSGGGYLPVVTMSGWAVSTCSGCTVFNGSFELIYSATPPAWVPSEYNPYGQPGYYYGPVGFTCESPDDDEYGLILLQPVNPGDHWIFYAILLDAGQNASFQGPLSSDPTGTYTQANNLTPYCAAPDTITITAL